MNKSLLKPYLLLTCLGIGLIPFPVFANDYLKPRIEVNGRAGNKRSILMTEAWMPVAQEKDRVLYSDMRFMADEFDNSEGNLGFGYREINDRMNAVLGMHGWIDRRRSDRGSTFYQATVGAEALGKDVDARVNLYLPLTGAKTSLTTNLNTAPYLAGSGIFYDTNGTIVEEGQKGIDAELGYRLPVFENHIDTFRIYAGGYGFKGDKTESIVGYRIRTAADITSGFNLGLRFQHDAKRGSQGFVEATIRFPFASKLSFKKNGLRSRLDESPERDIDIVTGSQTVAAKYMQPVINNTTQQQQRVLYVDNTNTNAGDGTKNNPFNTLADAQAALQPYDVLYVNHGDNTSNGMNSGVTINAQGVQLIGSGSNFIYENNKFSAGGQDYNGQILRAATTAPVITNTQAWTSGDMTGNGVLITASDVFVSGITVQGAKGNGFIALASGAGNSIDNVVISNVTSTQNERRGIMVYARNGGEIDNVTVQNSVSNGNQLRGIEIYAQSNNSRIANATINNNELYNISGAHTLISQSTNAMIDNLVISNNRIHDTATVGIVILPTLTGQFGKIVIENNLIYNITGVSGITVNPRDTASINELIIKNNIMHDISSSAISSAPSNNAIINILRIEGNTIYNSGGGISVLSRDTTQINNVILNRNTIYNIQSAGIGISSTQSGIMRALLSENRIYQTGLSGTATVYAVNINNDSTGVFIVDMGNGDLGSIGHNRIYNNPYPRDLFVDLMPGTTSGPGGGMLSAQYNWWGYSTGIAPGRYTLDGSTTLDVSNYLTE